MFKEIQMLISLKSVFSSFDRSNLAQPPLNDLNCFLVAICEYIRARVMSSYCILSENRILKRLREFSFSVE